MAKKRTKKAAPKSKALDRVPRKQQYDGPRMGVVVERLREQAARLAGLARAMEDGELGEITVDGHAMLVRGLNQIDNFADNASRAVREKKNEMEIL